MKKLFFLRYFMKKNQFKRKVTFFVFFLFFLSFSLLFLLFELFFPFFVFFSYFLFLFYFFVSCSYFSFSCSYFFFSLGTKSDSDDSEELTPDDSIEFHEEEIPSRTSSFSSRALESLNWRRSEL